MYVATVTMGCRTIIDEIAPSAENTPFYKETYKITRDFQSFFKGNLKNVKRV
jgi:hypothetical protein